jgi:hypothetical protein
MFPELQASVPSDSVSHPVLHSQTKDKSCAIMSGKTATATTLNFNKGDEILFTQSIVPHVFKYHESIDLSIDAEHSDSITLEVAVGLGVSGKGFAASDAQTLVTTLFQEATDLLQHEDLAAVHWDRFYWTSEPAGSTAMASSVPAPAHSALEQKYRRSSTAIGCDYKALMTVSISQSYISFTTGTSGDVYNPDCMRLLATVAVMQPSVSHVSAHLGVQLSKPSGAQQQESLSSISYADPEAGVATDQNAWVQSGTTDQTPYSTIGVDGTGYVLGNKQV